MQTQKLFIEALLWDCLNNHAYADDKMVEEAALRLTEHLTLEVFAIKEVIRQRCFASMKASRLVAVSTNIGGTT